MKRITVGRGNDCDIVIPDESDNVSRHHMVISYDILGRMRVSDTSSNGTYVNGRRLLKGASIPVTKTDEIRLGDNWPFDLSLVKDPYKMTRIWIVTIFLILVVAITGLLIWQDIVHQKEQERKAVIINTSRQEAEAEAWNKDSTEHVAPVETSIKLPEDEKNIPANSKKQATKRVNKNKGSKAVPRKDQKVKPHPRNDDKMPQREPNLSKEKDDSPRSPRKNEAGESSKPIVL